MPMTVRQRILAIRLLEKQMQNPEYAAGIGIQVRMVTKDSKKMEEKDANSVNDAVVADFFGGDQLGHWGL
jgi:hypothetical protein